MYYNQEVVFGHTSLKTDKLSFLSKSRQNKAVVMSSQEIMHVKDGMPSVYNL